MNETRSKSQLWTVREDLLLARAIRACPRQNICHFSNVVVNQKSLRSTREVMSRPEDGAERSER